MKTCPNCGELLGDSVKECFKCHCNVAYEFQRKETERREEAKRKEEAINKQLSKNPLFEYEIIVIEDLSSGQVDNKKIQQTLNEWSKKGWRLHSIYSSEIGRNSAAVSIVRLGVTINATINETVMIFERCIKG